MTRPNVVHKDEKRFVGMGKHPQNPTEEVAFFVISERKLEQVHPLFGTALFELQINLQGPMTRAQMELLRDTISDALDHVGTGLIAMVPPGTKLAPHPA